MNNLGIQGGQGRTDDDVTPSTFGTILAVFCGIGLFIILIALPAYALLARMGWFKP